jgi:hypothetical protein
MTVLSVSAGDRDEFATFETPERETGLDFPVIGNNLQDVTITGEHDRSKTVLLELVEQASGELVHEPSTPSRVDRRSDRGTAGRETAAARAVTPGSPIVPFRDEDGALGRA